MDTGVLIAIIAVVLGGVGLIGGVLGYVQGTAALHRATTARQRATGAEEAALQARAAAEATARSAEELLARVQRPEPSTGPVRLASTGPVGIAPQPSGATPRTGPIPEPPSPTVPTVPSAEPAPRPLAAPTPPERQSGAAFAFPLTGPPPHGQGPGTPPPVDPATPASGEAAIGPLAGTPRTIPPAVPAPADPVGGGRPAERQPADAFSFPVTTAPAAPEAAPPPTVVQQAQVVAPPVALAGEPALGPEVPKAQEGAPGPPEDMPAPPADPPAPPVDPPARPADPPAEPPALEADPPVPAVEEPAPPTAAVEEPAPAERGSRERIVAGSQDAPPMDWAEVLRTGAIPLPSVSRGTYSAPRRAQKPLAQGPARFELRTAGRQRFEAVNVGGEEALEARVEGAGDDPHLVRPLSARPTTVPAGGALVFSVLRVEGRGATAQILWTHAGEPRSQMLTLE